MELLNLKGNLELEELEVLQALHNIATPLYYN